MHVFVPPDDADDGHAAIRGGDARHLVAVGPEGGLTPEDVDATGLRPARPGDAILRTEFASVAGVVALLPLLGRFA